MDSAQLYAMKERLEGLRSYEATDIEKLARLLGTARAWPPPAPPSPDDLLNRWERRQVKPERDFMVLPGDGEDFVAYLQVSPVADPNSRISMDIAVHPRSRNMGIGSALYEMALIKARELQVPQLSASVYLLPSETRPESTNFLENRGFLLNSGYWQMRLDNLRAQPGAKAPDGYYFRTIKDIERDTERWAELVREAFREPTSGPKIAAQLAEPGASADGYFFVVDRASGQEVGTTRARIDVTRGERVGYVGTVGVLPEYRQRGLATALIQRTVEYLASLGVESAVLFVEGSNHNARRLYRKLGWREVFQTVHYWKSAFSDNDFGAGV